MMEKLKEDVIFDNKTSEACATLSGKKISKEIMIKIFSYLTPNELQKVSHVSTYFSKLVKHPTLQLETSSCCAMTALTTATMPSLSTVMESIPFPPPAAIQTTMAVVTTVSNPLKVSLPVESKITVPVLPESLPLIAEVPDVVPQEKEEEKDVVKISQVLAGYAPSYAHDYFPPEVNKQSVATFANTISFNVSRYPTITEITDSKSYHRSRKESEKNGQTKEASDHVKKRKKKADEVPKKTEHGQGRGSLQYIPAEYGREDHAKQIVTVSAAKTVTIVRPEVLASGRLLTHMSPVVRATSVDKETEDTQT